MKVLILGATGSIGRRLIPQALQRGHEVTVLVRRPVNIPGVRVIEGDALNPEDLDRAVAGQDAVVYALGAKGLGRTTLFSESTRRLIDAMKKHGVRRLGAIT